MSVKLDETMNLREGKLQKKVSILKGYKEQWFVLTKKGCLQYFAEKPTESQQAPKGQMILLLSDVMPKKDRVSFKISSVNNQKYSLRAQDSDTRDEWIQDIFCIRSELYTKMFRGMYANKARSESEYNRTAPEDNDNVNDSDFEDVPIVNEESLFQEKDEKPFFAVAAIDFGTTYSGCAFSTVNNFKSDPMKLETIEIDGKDKSTHKTPTVLLLNNNGTFHSFGAKAEREYASLAAKGKTHEFYYFERFKMQLYKEKKLSSNVVIKDASGKTMKAVLVFAICIEYIKDRVMERLSRAISNLLDDEIHWVLTVPAIWNEQARQFMSTAAEMAGIPRDNLSLALEPEAAAMCCKYLEIHKPGIRSSSVLGAFAPGARFMVVDMGGGTIDITVSEVLASGQLKEIYNATGGPWGGNYVNKEIVKTLSEAIGWEKIRKLRAEDLDEYFDLTQNIEIEKRCNTHGERLEIKISKEFGKKIKINDAYKEDVKAHPKSLELSASSIQRIMSNSIDKVTNHVKKLLQKEETNGVKTILLVGGYAASDSVQQQFRNNFALKFKIISPLNPDMIVLRGAVIIGHMREAIIGRVSRCHYGIALKYTQAERRISINESDVKIFVAYIKKGQTIQVGEVFTVPDIVVEAATTKLNIAVYTSEETEPTSKIDNEHFARIGSIIITVPQFKDKSVVNLTISYDETEFKVAATDTNTGRHFCGVFNFLEKELK